MARVLLAKCECCGRLKDDPTAAERQAGVTRTWWMVEDHGEPMTTLPLDFCSLGCLTKWALKMMQLVEAGQLDIYKGQFQPQDATMVTQRVKDLVKQMMQPWPEATATSTEGKADSEHG